MSSGVDGRSSRGTIVVAKAVAEVASVEEVAEVISLTVTVVTMAVERRQE
jgi:hypothetical protein